MEGPTMYREGQQIIDQGRMNFVLNQGALGDVITSLPAIIKARQHYAPELKMRVWGPSWQHELLEHLLKPYGEFEILNFEDFPMKKAARNGPEWENDSIAINQMAFNTHTRNRVHMVDYAFNCLLDAQPESMLERSYPTEASVGAQWIPGPYIVFPVGATSDNKLFRASVITPTMKWCLFKGYTPVVVGTKTSHTKVETTDKRMIPIVLRDEASQIQSTYLDLREKTTLLELRDICGRAAAVVGVDGGTLHLAGTTFTNIVYGLTTTLPKHRYIARYGDPSWRARYVGPRDLECAGCQSNWVMSRQDFRECFYGDNICTTKLHADDFIAGLEELGL
jgi:ADP-heptose:LPS heptosyltransferase